MVQHAKEESIFNELYKLDFESDGEEDSSNAQAVLASSKLPSTQKGLRKRRDRAHGQAYCMNNLARTTSAPVTRTSVSFPTFAAPALGKENAANLRGIEGSLSVQEAGQGENASEGRANDTTEPGKKRKRGQSLNGLPDSQQIFKGLSFFFFPNNDVAPIRKFRIRKAMEWGAAWIKTWKQEVTHIIMDKNLAYNDLLTFLKLQNLPSHVVLVNEDYPPDCIRFRFVVNPQQPQYRIAGHQDTIEVLKEAPDTPSDRSLQLKGTFDPIVTPSRTEESVPLGISSNEGFKPADDVVHVDDSKPSSMVESACDPMSEAIEAARATQALPIDLVEDEHLCDIIDSQDIDDEEGEGQRQAKTELKDRSFKIRQQDFMCMSKHARIEESANPNKRTIEILQQMATYYDRIKDHWRTTAYRKAISGLRKQTRQIMTAEEASKIPFIGQRLAEKIEEIVWTDRLRRLDNAKLDVNDEVLQTFLKIYSVGPAQAFKWIEQGYRSTNDLLENVDLTRNQKIGIEHLDAFQSRIPRTEMDKHDLYVREILNKVDARLEVTIGGSYRRGAPDCGDIDFIITKPRCHIEALLTIMLGTAIPRLFAEGYLKAGLATTRRDDGSKWHGAAALPGSTTWRRIDFLFVPWQEIGAAFIYFTGNDIFNRSIRLLASKKGFRLNQRGLWKDVARGKSAEQRTQGTLVEGKSERKIFELLGVPWRPPQHRNC